MWLIESECSVAQGSELQCNASFDGKPMNMMKTMKKVNEVCCQHDNTSASLTVLKLKEMAM